MHIWHVMVACGLGGGFPSSSSAARKGVGEGVYMYVLEWWMKLLGYSLLFKALLVTQQFSFEHLINQCAHLVHVLLLWLSNKISGVCVSITDLDLHV